MSLVTNLISFWELGEASGTRNDSHGTNHLTDNNTVHQGTGKVGNCANFVIADMEYLSHVDNASLSIGAGVQITFVAWVQLELGASGILGKWDGTQTEYALLFNGSTFQWSIRNTANTTQTSVLSTFPSITTTTWYFIAAWYDGAALKISVNVGTPDSIAYSGDINDSDGNFVIGAFADVAGTAWNGLIDQVGFWKRALSAAEITDLYNAGAGRSYAYILSTGAAAFKSAWARNANQVIFPMR